MSSYARPVREPTFSSIYPRPLVQLKPGPVCPELPLLPCPPRKPQFAFPGHTKWSLSTHLFPAAYPRTLPHVAAPLPAPAFALEGKEARAAWVQNVTDELLRAHEDAQEAQVSGKVAEGDVQPFWCVVNRYVRSDARGDGITLVLAHANGFTKEVRALALSIPSPASNGNQDLGANSFAPALPY
jgi:hypothetical protein